MMRESGSPTVRLVFIYDENGRPYSLELYSYSYNLIDKYYYITNVQGDVIRLIDDNNEVVANYTYDAWGKLKSITDAGGSAITASNHIAIRNPIRYRGYFYDEDTKLYYCNSRYYDPQTRRFINADAMVSTGQGFNGYNMFAYCGNNPVVRKDSCGNIWQTCIEFSAIYMPPNYEDIFGNHHYTPSLLDIIFEESGKLYLNSKGYELASWMYSYAFGNDGSQLEYDRLPPMLEEKLTNSEELRSILQKWINEASSSGIYWFDTKDSSVQFKQGVDTDLFYAVQKAEFRAWGWTDNGRWKINIFVWDDYDFDNLRIGQGSFIADSANNLGLFLQNKGTMVPYHWWIRYEYYFK